MIIAVMGAGAVGCYYGGMLARAGHKVILIGRQQHVGPINDRGLFLEASTFQEHVSIQATIDPSWVSEADVVLVCVKSADTEAAGLQISPYLNENSFVLSLQNGVDNADRLQSIVGRTVNPAVVYVASDIVGPGHVRHHGRGDLLIGSSPRSEVIALSFTEAGIPTTVSGDIRGALWRKLVLNCAYNALSAVSQLPYGRLIAVDGVIEVMKDVVDECIAVAAGSGISTLGEMMENVVALAGMMPNQKSSTAQDLARRKVSEIDHLNGHIVRQGKALGIPTPVNSALYIMVKLVEVETHQRT